MARYPGNYPKGKIITGLDAANKLPGTKVFHAGTALKDSQIVTNGGRVLGVTALDKDITAAQAAAYAAVECIQFEGAHFRRDIAAKALQGRNKFHQGAASLRKRRHHGAVHHQHRGVEPDRVGSKRLELVQFIGRKK